MGDILSELAVGCLSVASASWRGVASAVVDVGAVRTAWQSMAWKTKSMLFMHASSCQDLRLVWVHSSRWLGRTGPWLELTTCEEVIHDFKSLVGFEQGLGNLAWTRETGTGKRGSKLGL